MNKKHERGRPSKEEVNGKLQKMLKNVCKRERERERKKDILRDSAAGV